MAGAVGASVSLSALSPWVHSAFDQLLKKDDKSVNAQYAQFARHEQYFFDGYRDLVHYLEKVGPQWTTAQKKELHARLHQLDMQAIALDSPLVFDSMRNLLEQVRATMRAMPVAQSPIPGESAPTDPLGQETLASLGHLLIRSRPDFHEGDSANLRYWFGSGQALSCELPAAQPWLRLRSLLPPDIAPSKVPSCDASDDQPMRLFIQIYHEANRPEAQVVAARAIGRGLLVPGIENVSATAKRKQKVAPFVWDRRTWILHAPEEMQCVRSLAYSQDRLLNLPSGLKALPGVIELWIPPTRNEPKQ